MCSIPEGTKQHVQPSTSPLASFPPFLCPFLFPLIATFYRRSLSSLSLVGPPSSPLHGFLPFTPVLYFSLLSFQHSFICFLSASPVSSLHPFPPFLVVSPYAQLSPPCSLPTLFSLLSLFLFSQTCPHRLSLFSCLLSSLPFPSHSFPIVSFLLLLLFPPLHPLPFTPTLLSSASIEILHIVD